MINYKDCDSSVVYGATFFLRCDKKRLLDLNLNFLNVYQLEI